MIGNNEWYGSVPRSVAILNSKSLFRIAVQLLTVQRCFHISRSLFLVWVDGIVKQQPNPRNIKTNLMVLKTETELNAMIERGNHIQAHAIERIAILHIHRQLDVLNTNKQTKERHPGFGFL